MDPHTPADTLDSRQTISFDLRRFLVDGPVNWLAGLAIAWCGLYALLFLYHGASLVLYPFDVDNSEAYLVYQGLRITQGQFLYPSLNEPPYLVDNYPPLYPLLSGLGFLFTGVNFHWPRAISLVSTFSTAMLLGYWVFLLARNKIASVLASLIYLSFYHVNDWGALARVDALGVALAVAGVVIFEKTRSWKSAFPFIVLALLTRQTLFAAPLALFFSLFELADRKNAFRFLGLLAVCCAVIGLVLLALSAGQAWNHLVWYNANEYRFSDVINYLNQWLRLYTLWGSAPLAVLFWYYPRCGQNEEKSSPVLFWFTLFAIGEALLCGKIGSAPNYLLSLAAASSVGVGLIFHELVLFRNQNANGEKRPQARPLLFFLCVFIFQLGATWHWPHSRLAFSETPTLQDGQQASILLNSVKRMPGPILSDRAGLALMAGHPPVFDPFILTQLVREGKWDQTEFLKQIREKKYSLVILQFNLDDPNWDRERFTPEMIMALQESYSFERKIVRYSSGILRYFLYLPKP